MMIRRESKRVKPNHWQDSGGSAKAKKSFLVSELSITYVVLLSALYLAITLYYTVTRIPSQTVSFYEAMYLVLYLTGIGVLIYLLVFIRDNKNRVIRRDPSSISIEHIGQRLSHQDVNRTATAELPRLSFAGEGFNWYLRAGLIGFNFFSCVYNLIRVISEARDNFAQCGRVLVMIICCLQSSFFCIQTVFILLNHKIIFLINKAVIRLCFAHLLIVNISSWIHAGLGEISEGVSEVLRKESEALAKNRTGDSASGDRDARFCDDPNSPVALTRPYLMPAVIEYVLLAIPMLLELLWRIGNTKEAREKEEEEEEERHEEEKFPRLHKAKRGLIAGIVAFVLSLISVLSFFLLDKTHQIVGLAIYHVEAFVLNCLTAVFCALALPQLNKLKFLRVIEGRLDEMILRLSLFGTFFYYIIIISHAIDTFDLRKPVTTQAFTGTEIILSIMTLLSCCFQAFVIINGMHRAPAIRDHIVRKPGRPYVTVLLCMNLALWMIDTFQVKKSEMAFAVTSGRTGLSVTTSVALMHVALPMVILFRFHSTVCLSSIWSKSYMLE